MWPYSALALIALVVGLIWLGRVARLDALSLIGIGAAIVVAAAGSFVSFIGTQAMTGRENIATLFAYFAVWFVPANGLAAAIGLLPTLRIHRKVYAIGVLGFLAGAAVAAALAAILMMAHVLNIYTAMPLLVLPGFIGCVVLASATNTSQGEGR